MTDSISYAVTGTLAKIPAALRAATDAGDTEAVELLRSLESTGRETLTHARGRRLETNDAQAFLAELRALRDLRPDLHAQVRADKYPGP